MLASAKARKRMIGLKLAGAIAGVAARTILRWQDRGDLTDHRTNGGHRRVDEAELRALLDRRKRENCQIV